MAKEPRGPSGGFPSTHWSQILAVECETGGEKRSALDSLLVRYLPALRAHLTYRGIHPEQADDVLHDFVAKKILEKDLISLANPQAGKFRTFLLTALDRFVSNQIRRAKAKKRRPEGNVVSLEVSQEPSATGTDHTAAFEIAWAREVIAEALRRMKRTCETADRSTLWEVFNQRILLPTLEGNKPLDYRQLIAQYGFSSPLQVANTVVTAKRMYARMLRAVVSEYAGGEDEVEAELADLRKNLSKRRA